MNDNILSYNERIELLNIARQALEHAARAKPLPMICLEEYSPVLRAPGASFVTLKKSGRLRGCIGTLTPFQPLVLDVQDRAVAAGFNDHRFPAVIFDELAEIEIEISRLTQPKPLNFSNPEDLPRLLRPGIDGVVIHDGFRRATFLPQVWESLPISENFLGELCQKMGANRDLWRNKILEVETYQIEEFHE
ncbi:MAG: AmmeMemoRadiSam system protein A [Chloroflexota bacterium]